MANPILIDCCTDEELVRLAVLYVNATLCIKPDRRCYSALSFSTPVL